MDDAVARRERLKALKQAAQLVGTGEAAAAEQVQQPEKPVLKFRNYAVKDEKIEHEKVRATINSSCWHAGHMPLRPARTVCYTVSFVLYCLPVL